MFTVPKGSRNIMVVEVIASGNTLAVSATDEKTFFLNGDNRENADGEKDFGGVKGVYEHPEPDREEVVIGGPTTQDLVFYVVYFSSKNPVSAIRYAYSVPKSSDSKNNPDMSTENPGPTPPPVYHWEFLEWAPCSVKCGGGNSISKPSCVEERTGKVTDDLCKDLPDKPEVKTRMCNAEECKAKWKVGPWGPCSGCTFRSGVRKRKVQCVREAQHDGEDDIIAESKVCVPLGPKPGTRELCSTRKKCTDMQEQSNSNETDSMKRERKSPYDNLWKHLIYAPVQSSERNMREEIKHETGRGDENEEKGNNAYFLKPHHNQKHKKVDKNMHRNNDATKQKVEKNNKYHTYNKHHRNMDDHVRFNDEINSEDLNITPIVLSESNVDSQDIETSSNHYMYKHSDNFSSDTKVTDNSDKMNSSTELDTKTTTELTTEQDCAEPDNATVVAVATDTTATTAVPKALKNKINQFLNDTKSIVDVVPPEEIKLIVVPLKMKAPNKISDELFEKIGDKLGDQIDMSKKQVFCGKEAAKRMQSNLTTESTTTNEISEQ